MQDTTTATFEWPQVTEDQLDFVEDHLRKVYSPDLRDAVVEGLYNPDARVKTTITKVTITVQIEVTEREVT